MRRVFPSRRSARADELPPVDISALSGLFAAPRWLRDAGFTAWLLVGLTLLTVGLVWLLSLTAVIVVPVVTAGVIAAVAGQLVSALHRRGLPRGLGALVVLLLIVLAAAATGYLIMRGIVSESASITDRVDAGAEELTGWVEDAGIEAGSTEQVRNVLDSGTGDAFHALVKGLSSGLLALSSLAFFLAMTTLSLFFLLKDGPPIRRWIEGSMARLPREVAHTITERSLQALRGYFLGVTIIAGFNAVLVGGGALALGVPMAGTIAAVTFVGAYVPYLGAWTAGAFSVLIALGTGDPAIAGGMVAIQLLSNGPLQQIVQPIAYGATLGIHPLAVLIVTIAGGALFGAVGLILAAPVTSALTRISADLASAAQREEARRAEGLANPPPAPG
jgi:putative heme transporter